MATVILLEEVSLLGKGSEPWFDITSSVLPSTWSQ
ncbi:hypothetical protein K3495_g7999 [Podosphaera aphanis]|nr:hypothetical protein K3495_g7999 [Podosphaera aphanis]